MHWSEIVRSWGTTAEERQRCFPCDIVLPDHNEAYYRGVTVFAEPATLFRWLCQMRVAPYSYDWLDNDRIPSAVLGTMGGFVPGIAVLTAVGKGVVDWLSMQPPWTRPSHETRWGTGKPGVYRPGICAPCSGVGGNSCRR